MTHTHRILHRDSCAQTRDTCNEISGCHSRSGVRCFAMLGRRAARNFGTGNISNNFICVWTLHDQTPNPCALATLFPQGVVSNPTLFRDRTGAVRLMAQHRAVARQSSRIASYAVLAAGDRSESCSVFHLGWGQGTVETQRTVSCSCCFAREAGRALRPSCNAGPCLVSSMDSMPPGKASALVSCLDM